MSSRYRTSNFSLKEKSLFIDIMVKSFPFLHEDKSHSKIHNDARNKAWKELTNEFHTQLADQNIHRTTKQLKTLYENIKHKIKRNIVHGNIKIDVKTAKDIPLDLFMELKEQYENELTNGSYNTNPSGSDDSYKCSNRNRFYSNPLKTRNSAGGEVRYKPKQKKTESWMNSKNQELLVVDNKTVIISERNKAGRTIKSVINFPPSIRVRYPTSDGPNKLLYEETDESDDGSEQYDNSLNEDNITSDDYDEMDVGSDVDQSNNSTDEEFVRQENEIIDNDRENNDKVEEMEGAVGGDMNEGEDDVSLNEDIRNMMLESEASNCLDVNEEAVTDDTKLPDLLKQIFGD